MEKRDLYDENRVFTGKTIFKDEEVPIDSYILIVIVFMQNSDGRFLIQKRSEDKGGLWASTGGHPKAGENSMQGLITEVKEELGIDISNEDIKLVDTFTGHNKICDLYYTNMNINIDKINFQKEEVQDVKLASIDEIKDMITNGEFHKSHGKAFLDILNYLSNR